ncbi:glutathione S-transferase 1-like [Chrysoperla carnea]|uniref:glutathione S-transferase 1-like n=1 Tax=Chrysoperla carnea TaxID=189513 RepID=UPI001D067874|nr:glutathione S-transferase 1-like [Chrysoperla carnea]
MDSSHMCGAIKYRICTRKPPKIYGVRTRVPVRNVLMVCKALNLEIEFIEMDLFAGDHNKPEFVKMNPQRTVPTMDDDGFYLWDSHAIVTYLVSKYGKDDSLYPKDLKKRATVDRLLHFDSGILLPRARNIFHPIMLENAKTIPEKNKERVYEAYDFLEVFFDESSSWIAGKDLTVADLCIIPVVTTLKAFLPIDESKYPKILAWIEKCKGLPYYVEINKRGNDAFVERINKMLLSS